MVLSLSIDDGGHAGTGGSLSDSSTVTLLVSAQNDAPVNTVPGSQSMQQDGTLVFSAGNGNLVSVADVDAGANDVQVTLSASNGVVTLGSTSGLSFLVGSGAGDATATFAGTLAAINNALSGLSFTATPGYHGPAALQVTSDDRGFSGAGGAQTDTDVILINVAQANPSIVSVAGSSANGSYKAGDSITLAVTFDQAVTVTGGTPTLLLETGATDRSAVYTAGSGTNTLTFAYVVQPGDLSADLDYESTAALSLNGASIASAALGGGAILTLPAPGAANSLGANAALVIDGVAPAVTSVAVPASATYTQSQVLDFTVNFSETVTVDTSGGTPRLAIALDVGGTAYASYLSGSGTTALTFQMTVAVGQVDLTGIALNALQANGAVLSDGVGNNAVLALAGVQPTTGVRVNAPAPNPEPEPPVTPPTTPPVTPPTPGVPDDDGIPRWLVDRAAKRIVLFRIPIERLSHLHRNDDLHRRVEVEGCVFRAAAEYMNRDPWDLGSERFRDF